MSVDIKSKIAELKARNGERKILWKPKPGKQTIRIVPYLHHPQGWSFIELYFHYNVSKKTLISPSSFGRPDPIKEFADMLQASGDTEKWKQGKKLQPTMRTYVPILVRGEEGEGIKYFGFGSQIYEQLLLKMDSPKWGDITHPTEGRDIEITFEKATGPTTFPKTTIDVDPERTAVTTDRAVLESMKEMPDVSKLWSEPSYVDLKAILKEYIETGEPVNVGGSTETGHDDEDEAPAVVKGVAVETPKNSTSDADVTAAFKSYFNK